MHEVGRINKICQSILMCILNILSNSLCDNVFEEKIIVLLFHYVTTTQFLEGRQMT